MVANRSTTSASQRFEFPDGVMEAVRTFLSTPGFMARYNKRNLKDLLKEYQMFPRVGGDMGTEVTYKNRKYVQLGSKRYLPTSKAYRTAMAREDKRQKKNLADIIKEWPLAVQTFYDSTLGASDPTGELRAAFQRMNRGEVDEVVVSLQEISAKDAILLARSIVRDRLLLVKKSDGEYYTLSDRVMARLIKALDDVEDPDNIVLTAYEVDQYGVPGAKPSDTEFITDVTEVQQIVFLAEDFRLTKKGKKRIKPAGGFFKYLHTTSFDWSRYGVFKEVKAEDHNDNCLWTALKEGGFPEARLQDLKIHMQCRDVPEVKLKKICSDFEICIRLQVADGKVHWHGDKKHPVYSLGLLDEHYFLVDRVEVTSFCLEHYEEVRDVKDCHRIVGKNQKGVWKREDRFITSYQLFKILIQDKERLLKPIPYDNEIMRTQFYKKVQDVRILEVNPQNCRDTKVKGERIDLEALDKEPAEVPETGVFRFVIDFETTTEGERHKAYLCNIRYDDRHHKTCFGEDCAEQALDWAVKNYWLWTGCKSKWKNGTSMVIMAHNLAYDIRFLLERIICTSILPKDNKILQANGLRTIYGDNVKITFKDTLCLIPMPLRDFGKCFNLPMEKEVMPYGLYTQTNVKKQWCPVVEAVKVLEDSETSAEDIEHFRQVLRSRRIVKGENFDILAYSAYYCERDTEVTLKGYMTFREWVVKAMNIDTDECITTTSIAKAVAFRSGCFDEVRQVSGNVREFIQKCVVGGRVMTRENRRVHAVGEIADFDGVSLYPSALARMPGFLKGTPKVIQDDQKNMKFLRSVDGYFVRVKVTAVKKHYAFPLISVVKADGVRDFTNNLEGQEVYLDRVGLEDAMEFQGLEVKILQGLYFNEGRNDTINTVIRSLFELRRRHKQNKNPIEVGYKLVMNTLYGFTIQKAPEFEHLVKTDEELKAYLPINYNFIHSVTPIGGHKNMVKKYQAIDGFFNYAQVGVEVLSMSKRIMNEVMCTAEDSGIPIFYQDTDSQHLFQRDVPKLAAAFKEKYGRELIGEDLGQFHDDFKLEGAKDVCSTEFIGLGKKCYLDTLRGVGEEDGSLVTGLHIRMKGVPTSCVKYTAKELVRGPRKKKAEDDRENFTSVRSLYMDLLNGEGVTFDLTQNGRAAKFEMRKDMTVRTKATGEFTRTLLFNKDGREPIFLTDA